MKEETTFDMSRCIPVELGRLLQSDVNEDPFYRDDGLCVVGVFGKSSAQPSPLKESIINSLSDKHVFTLFGAPEEDVHIQAVYQQESRVLYLLLSTVADSRETLVRAAASLNASEASTGHSDAHELWSGLDRAHCLHVLYLFSVCHVLLLVSPNQSFDVTYDRLFRALDALRQKALPLIRAAIKDCPVSKEWKLNCRPCPPRLLFVFHMNGSLKVNSNGSDSGSSDKPKKHSPRRRLQHALEDQIYRIFRKSRVLTNQSSNCLFTVPANQAFVYVMPSLDEDPVGGLISQLRSNCIMSEPDTTIVPVSGPRRYQQMRHSNRQFGVGGESAFSTSSMGGQLADCSLKDFLWQHVELVLTKKGFDDSVGRNPQPSHFELPTFTKWIHIASKLHQVLIKNTEEDIAELAAKVQSQHKVLEGFLDADTKFSENRCQKALPLAHSAYQSNLPHNYTTTVHKNQLAVALRVYSQHARGVAFQRYALQLHEDCYKFWSNGHQLCEERSLTDQHCVHKFHLLPQTGEKPDVDRNPPVLNHNSRGRSTSSCNCGRKQAPRDDPFDVQAANYDFYQMLEEKCCGKLERIEFPVFQSSTLDPAPATNTQTSQTPRPPRPPSPNEASGDADRAKEPPSTAPATHTPAGQTHTPADTSLSLALSLGQSTDSLGPYGDGEENQHKRPSLVDRQPSTVEYLPGMMHSGCPKGLVPKFSSWSLVKLGPAKSYNCHTGLEQPGFLPGSSFLLPWDLVIRSRSEEDPATALTDSLEGGTSSWPAPNKSLASKRGSTGGLGRGRRRDDMARVFVGFEYEDSRGRRFISCGPDKIVKFSLGRGRRRDDMARVFVGFEYEDSRGRRFISCGPDKIVKVLGPGGAKEPASRVLNTDMPLYIPSPSQGRSLKPNYAQLTRLYVVVPDASLEVTLNPQVQPGPAPCPLFHPEQTELQLPSDGLWVLRFPFSYCAERGPCYPPKENQPLGHYKVLRGILKATTANPVNPPQ